KPLWHRHSCRCLLPQGGRFGTGKSACATQSWRRPLAVLLAVLSIGSLPAQQQLPATPASQTPGQGEYKFKVESQLVLVNVVARDKSGKPVTDLKGDDFTFLEDGKPQKIASFDFENLDSTPLSAGAGPSQQTAEGKPGAPASASSRPLLPARTPKKH